MDLDDLFNESPSDETRLTWADISDVPNSSDFRAPNIPEPDQPDVGQVDVGQADVVQPNAAQPDAAQSDIIQPIQATASALQSDPSPLAQEPHSADLPQG